MPIMQTSYLSLQPQIVVGTETVRIGSKVYRLDKSFSSDESAIRYQDTLEMILAGQLDLVATHTESRSPDEMPDFRLPIVQDLVVHDINVRREQGVKKYKVQLQPFDGSDPAIEKYQELLDAVVYFRQELYEKYGK